MPLDQLQKEPDAQLAIRSDDLNPEWLAPSIVQLI